MTNLSPNPLVVIKVSGIYLFVPMFLKRLIQHGRIYKNLYCFLPYRRYTCFIFNLESTKRIVVVRKYENELERVCAPQIFFYYYRSRRMSESDYVSSL